MRTILATLAFITPLISQAAIPDVHTSTLNLSSIVDYYDSTALTVLSDQGGATQVTTAAWQTANNTAAGGSYTEGNDYQISMTLAPAAGYVITGYSISALASGTLYTSPKPPEANGTWVPGVAKNLALIYLSDGKGGFTTKEIDNITTPVQFEYGVHGLSLDHATNLTFSTLSSAGTAYGRWEDMNGEYKYGSYAQLSLSAPSLTIYTALAPVPEPETWGMLLAGIALIGVAKRRSKR